MSRKSVLDNVFTYITKNKILYIKKVNTCFANSLNVINKLYNKFLNNGYEGIVIRFPNGIYKTNITKSNIRSKEILKLKPNFSGEYKIVDFIEGKGSNKGAIIFILQTKNNKYFNVVPNWSLSDRKKAYINSLNNFDNLYKNKLLTISYQDLSNDNIPLRAKGIAIRDYE